MKHQRSMKVGSGHRQAAAARTLGANVFGGAPPPPVVVPGPPSARTPAPRQRPPPPLAGPANGVGGGPQAATVSAAGRGRPAAAPGLHGAGQAPAADAVPGRPPPMPPRPAGTGGVGDASTAPSESARAAAVAGSAAPANVVAPGPVGVFATPHPSLCAPRPRSPWLVTARGHAVLVAPRQAGARLPGTPGSPWTSRPLRRRTGEGGKRGGDRFGSIVLQHESHGKPAYLRS